MANSKIPQPPLAIDNEALHRCLTDIISFLRQTYETGSKILGFTQDQIDSFTDPIDFEGTIVLNTTTGALNVSYIDSGDGTLKWREI